MVFNLVMIVFPLLITLVLPMNASAQIQRVRSFLACLISLRRDVSAYNRDVLPIDQEGIQRLVLVEVCRRNIYDAANATSILRGIIDCSLGNVFTLTSLCDDVDSAIAALRCHVNSTICRPYYLDEL